MLNILVKNTEFFILGGNHEYLSTSGMWKMVKKII